MHTVEAWFNSSAFCALGNGNKWCIFQTDHYHLTLKFGETVAKILKICLKTKYIETCAPKETLPILKHYGREKRETYF